MIDKFNVRVYALIVNGHKLLVSKEQIDHIKMFKFPGGGLEFGEGLKDAILRELKEELKLTPLKIEQFYISESFVQSQLRDNEQVLAVYYRIWYKGDLELRSIEQATTFGSKNNLSFEWRNLDDTLLKVLSFDTDKEALTRLIERLNTEGELFL